MTKGIAIQDSFRLPVACVLIACLTFSLLCSSARAQTAPSDSILIRHISLLSQEDTLDLDVSLIIVNGHLELVTTDEIASAPGAKVYDGGGGFLMGRMIIGQLASFVILRENPRENFDIFINTRPYVIFAMEEGRIVINNLHSVNLAVETKKRLTWAAYNPPPMAVPFNYYSSRKWNKFKTKYISGLFNGILALDRVNWLTQNQNSEAQVGDLSSSTFGEIRALRFGVIGTLNFNKPWTYTVFFASNTFDRDYTDSEPKLLLYDFRLDIPILKGVTLSVGKQKEPISMSRLTTLVFVPMQERQAAADAFLPARNWGLLLNSTYWQNRGTWGIGVFKNLVDSDTSFSKTPTQITGRVTGLPYLTEDESNLVHLGLGVRYSDAKQPVVARTESEFFISPVFVETAEMAANHFFTYDLELYWRKGPILLGGEYIGNKVSASALDNPGLSGFKLMGSWALTGEMRPYRKRSGIFDPLPVSKPVGHGGSGAFEAALRYSQIDLDDGPIQGGEMRTLSAGINWWPSPRAELSVNYRYIWLNRFGLQGQSSGLNIRLMLILD